jgi:hypothetical protein
MLKGIMYIALKLRLSSHAINWLHGYTHIEAHKEMKFQTTVSMIDWSTYL